MYFLLLLLKFWIFFYLKKRFTTKQILIQGVVLVATYSMLTSLFYERYSTMKTKSDKNKNNNNLLTQIDKIMKS